MARVRDQLRPEKKRYRREIFITTGKKKVPVVCLAGTRSITTGKKKIQAGNFHFDRKKKSSSRLSGGYAINYDRKKKDTGGKFSLRVLVLVKLDLKHF